MVRISLDADPGLTRQVTVSRAEAHYLGRVMRLKSGALVEAITPTGRLYHARWDGRQMLTLVSLLPDPPAVARRITLFQALLKGDRFTEVVEKGTEAGVARFVPLITDRTIVRAADQKLLRWQRVAREAAEQCRRREIPSVSAPIRLQEVPLEEPGMRVLVLDPEGETWRVLAQTFDAPDGEVGLIVGPEGGLTDHERQYLRAAGVPAVSLGPRIYRAENAGVWCALLFLSVWEG
jgi:16S rRNA (uracil1498-N3)-methyltransferase